MPVFPLTQFLAMFKEFNNSTKYTQAYIQAMAIKASMHVTPESKGMPMQNQYRQYAWMLMTAHLIELDDLSDSADTASLSGTPFKATIGSVTVESTKQNSFETDDWNYWLNQTKHGRELLGYLDTWSQGIFTNTPNDSVRDLV